MDWELFQRDGYLQLPGLIDASVCEALKLELEILTGGRRQAGLRSLIERSQRVRSLAQTTLGLELPGGPYTTLRVLLFDKSPRSNWNLTWHRDRVTAVPKKADLEGFSAWSIKDGVPHVRPPLWFLRAMVTARLHLDPTPEDNGALRGRRGSHDREGDAEEVVFEAEAGDVLLMNPLLLHASAPARRPRRRRVLHFEFIPSDKIPDELS